MVTIESQQNLIDYIENEKLNIESLKKRAYVLNEKNATFNLEDYTFNKIEIWNRDFECVDFYRVVFKNCVLKDVIFSACLLSNVEFINCDFLTMELYGCDLENVRFSNCRYSKGILSDTYTSGVIFEDCKDLTAIDFNQSRSRDYSFINCTLYHVNFNYNVFFDVDILRFHECMITKSIFSSLNLSSSKFISSKLAICSFNNCTLVNKTLIESNKSNDSPNFIDIKTLINSDNLDSQTLESFFSIHHSDIKSYLIEMTNPMEFQSVFISYSFKDQDFARILNNELNKRGILTFLWEKDAPGGKRLKKIMTENISKKDRVLFIASKSSLKSEACQYELSIGRKKQEAEWIDVMFPVHIDDFLFDIEKEQIKPVSLRDEYWENISELKEYNSKSFCDFVSSESHKSIDFENAIDSLAEDLRRKKSE